jgi:hypothetical protein
MAKAANYKIDDWYLLFSNYYAAGDDSAMAIKAVLAKQQPVAIGLRPREGFMNLRGSNGLFSDTTSPLTGAGHAVLAVGYDQDGLLIQNSWGTGWGDHGFGRLSWDVVRQDVGEAWVVNQIFNSVPISTPHVVSVSAIGDGTATPAGGTKVGPSAILNVGLSPGFGQTASVSGTCGGAIIDDGRQYMTNPIITDCTVKVEFVPLTYTVTARADPGGTISPSGSLEVEGGETSKVFKITPDAGYLIAPLGTYSCCFGCSGSFSDSTYTAGPFGGNCEICASFVRAEESYIVTASAGTGGKISPSGSFGVKKQDSVGFSVIPDDGYSVSSVGGSCGVITLNSADARYWANPITDNCTVTATFTKDFPYTVSASAGTGGTINPSGNIEVAPGEKQRFTITPNPGYTYSPFDGIGGTCGGNFDGYNYTTNYITADCTVTATFAPQPKTYTVTASYGPEGFMVPSGNAAVPAGTVKTYTIVPSSEEYTPSVNSTCGGALSGNTYTTNPITADCTVTASFVSKPTYTVTTSAGSGGTIIPSGSFEMIPGASRWLYIYPDTGYTVSSIGGTCDGSTYSSGTSYLIGPITADCTVTVKFAPQTTTTYTVTASAGANGSISPSGAVAVNSGATKAFTVTPNMGYKISSVSGCNGTLSGSTYTTGAITGDCTVTASFVSQTTTYTVTTSAGTGGTISPSGSYTQVYAPGQYLTLTITPDSGYSIDSVGGTCGGHRITAGSSEFYATNPVTADCTVTVTFTPPPTITYTVTTNAGKGGTINPSGPVSATGGTTRAFTVTPDAGYYIYSIYGNCGDTVNGNIDFTGPTTYTTKPIISNCTVSAVFIESAYTVTASANPGGSISPSSFTTYWGQAAEFTVTPKPGFYVANILSSCGDMLNGNISYINSITYTTEPITANCWVTASFAPLKTYAVTASAGTGGSISPTGYSTAYEGRSLVFTATPNTGYVISSFGGTCGGTLSGNTFTTNAITANCTVSAVFIKTYTVTANAGANGTISPAGASTMISGTTKTFTITPNTGYRISNATGCGGTLNGNIYTTGPVTANCTVTASFAIQSYTLTASAGTGGAISPASATVNHGATRAFTLTPSAGYAIASVGGTCGGTLNNRTYTTLPATANCTVVAVFAPLSLTVTASAGAGGAISPSGGVAAQGGSAQTFTLPPSARYAMSSVGGTCGGTLSGNTYTTKAITANCTVTASFKTQTVITASAGANGTISPAGAVGVNSGTSGTFTVTPNTGYRISTVGGTCGGTLSDNTYTTNAVTKNCTVTASFAVQTFTVTASADANGKISPTSVTGVNYGTAKSFTVTPNAGYGISSVGGTCGGTLSGNTYKTNPVVADCTVVAAFAPLGYTITASAGTGGMISPSGAVAAEGGASTTFTLTPDAGYAASSVGGTCGGTLSGNTYTTKAITKNCTVTASFKAQTVITASAGANGTISPAGAVGVASGTSGTFTIMPNSGYRISSVSGTCGGTLNGNTYTTNSISRNCTVTTSFVRQ